MSVLQIKNDDDNDDYYFISLLPIIYRQFKDKQLVHE